MVHLIQKMCILIHFRLDSLPTIALLDIEGMSDFFETKENTLEKNQIYKLENAE